MNKKYLTIILQLRDNHDFTFRWLDYACATNCNFNIYIADGSSDDKVKKYLIENNLKTKLHIEYVKLGYDSSWKKYCEKIFFALNKIKTPYVLLADNDDFYNFDSVQKCIDRLNENDKLISCAGNTVTFNIMNGHLNGSKTQFNIHEKTPLMNDNCLENIKSYLADHNGIYYSVHRKVNFKKAWEINNNLNFSNARMTEFFLEMYILASGKVDILPISYYYRQYGNNIGNSSNFSNDFLNEMLNFNWHKDINNIIRLISEKLVKSDKSNPDKIKKELMDCLKVSLRNWIINGLDIRGKSKNARNARKLMMKNAIKFGALGGFYEAVKLIKTILNFKLYFKKNQINDQALISEFLNNFKPNNYDEK
jgi:glycosyltransferase domain-containing protein